MKWADSRCNWIFFFLLFNYISNFFFFLDKSKYQKQIIRKQKVSTPCRAIQRGRCPSGSSEPLRLLYAFVIQRYDSLPWWQKRELPSELVLRGPSSCDLSPPSRTGNKRWASTSPRGKDAETVQWENIPERLFFLSQAWELNTFEYIKHPVRCSARVVCRHRPTGEIRQIRQALYCVFAHSHSDRKH